MDGYAYVSYLEKQNTPIWFCTRLVPASCFFEQTGHVQIEFLGRLVIAGSGMSLEKVRGRVGREGGNKKRARCGWTYLYHFQGQRRLWQEVSSASFGMASYDGDLPDKTKWEMWVPLGLLREQRPNDFRWGEGFT